MGPCGVFANYKDVGYESVVTLETSCRWELPLVGAQYRPPCSFILTVGIPQKGAFPFVETPTFLGLGGETLPKYNAVAKAGIRGEEGSYL